jgi:multisubunit Na+/H+ antiporter MnhC subunit
MKSIVIILAWFGFFVLLERMTSYSFVHTAIIAMGVGCLLLVLVGVGVWAWEQIYQPY